MTYNQKVLVGEATILIVTLILAILAVLGAAWGISGLILPLLIWAVAMVVVGVIGFFRAARREWFSDR